MRTHKKLREKFEQDLLNKSEKISFFEQYIQNFGFETELQKLPSSFSHTIYIKQDGSIIGYIELVPDNNYKRSLKFKPLVIMIYSNVNINMPIAGNFR